jgi:ABC-type nitrate/sulfonate/bicarbonate transport system permease component
MSGSASGGAQKTSPVKDDVAPSGDSLAGRAKTRSFPPLRGLLPLGLLLLMWQVFGEAGSPYFPRPSAWAAALLELVDSGELLPAITATVRSVLIAIVAATLFGSALGLAVGASRAADRALGPTLEFFRASPSSALVPIAVLLLGYTTTMKIAVVVVAAIWPILLNVRAAMRELNPTYLDVAAMLHMPLGRRLRVIVLPAVASAILLGVRVAAPITLIVVLLVEILTGVPGLGALLAAAQQRYQSDELFALLALTGVLALALNAVVALLEKRVLRHRKPG